MEPVRIRTKRDGWPLFPLKTIGTSCAQMAALSIPNDPSLAGAIFYDQGFFLDPAANPFGAVSTLGAKWTIGSGRGGPGSLVNAFGPSARECRGWHRLPAVGHDGATVLSRFSG